MANRFRYDIDIFKGTTPNFLFRLLQSSGDPPVSSPINLTGYEASMSIGWKDDLIRKIMTINALAGEITTTLSTSDSRAIPADGSASYEIEVRPTAGDQIVEIYGTIKAHGGYSDD